jgi:hypothetical protein
MGNEDRSCTERNTLICRVQGCQARVIAIFRGAFMGFRSGSGGLFSAASAGGGSGGGLCFLRAAWRGLFPARVSLSRWASERA